MVPRGWTLLALVIIWLFLQCHHEVTICGFELNVSTIGWIAITFGMHINFPLKMNPVEFGNPLTFPVLPSSGLNIRLKSIWLRTLPHGISDNENKYKAGVTGVRWLTVSLNLRPGYPKHLYLTTWGWASTINYISSESFTAPFTWNKSIHLINEGTNGGESSKKRHSAEKHYCCLQANYCLLLCLLCDAHPLHGRQSDLLTVFLTRC